MMDIASTLTDNEMIALGFSPVAGQDIEDPDNDFVDRLMHGGALPETDRDGRMIISWRQYEDIHSRKGRLDNYSLRMYMPGKKGVYRIQASKYRKWLGYGYRAVGEGLAEEAARPKAVRPVAVPADSAMAPTIYFCNDKYPDCGRFFDSPKGLETHWRLDHSGVKRSRTAAKPRDLPTEE